MAREVVELLMAPLLVGCSTLAHRRWGARTGGLVSALPAVVAPLLLIGAQTRGASFAEREANGILLGLAALSGFCVAYARAAGRTRWGPSLAAGWATAAALAALVGWLGGDLNFPGGLLVAAVALSLAWAAMPRPAAQVASRALQPRGELAVRMVITGALVGVLAAAAQVFGPLVGGVLAGLPVLASVLAVFTHRADGPTGVLIFLRGMLEGMGGFVAFCALVALLIVPLGTAAAFAIALFASAIAGSRSTMATSKQRDEEANKVRRGEEPKRAVQRAS